MVTFTKLLATAIPRPLWSDMASLPTEQGGLYMLQMLNFVMLMLNGLLCATTILNAFSCATMMIVFFSNQTMKKWLEIC